MTFGKRLALLRGSISQQAAAARAGISQQQWSKLERDLIDPADSTKIGAIAKAWGMSVDELLGGVLPVYEPLKLQEASASYNDKSIASSPEDDVIETARVLWDRACASNRVLAATIAKVIIVLVSGANAMASQSLQR